MELPNTPRTRRCQLTQTDKPKALELGILQSHITRRKRPSPTEKECNLTSWKTFGAMMKFYSKIICTMKCSIWVWLPRVSSKLRSICFSPTELTGRRSSSIICRCSTRPPAAMQILSSWPKSKRSSSESLGLITSKIYLLMQNSPRSISVKS